MAVAAKQKIRADLYEADFVRWAEVQGRLLAEKRAGDLDWNNLAEEIESLGRREKTELRSRLIVLLIHLLKWQFQPERRGHSWQTTIGDQRTHIEGILATSPSLQSFRDGIFVACFETARRRAAEQTKLPTNSFPRQPPFSVDETLDYDFMPGPPWSPEDLR